MSRIGFGVFPVAHGAVHLLYPAPPSEDSTFPFVLDDSWLIPDTARRWFGLALMAAAALFLAAGLAAWGVPGLADRWRPILLSGAAVSLVLMGAYRHPWLSIGVVLSGGLSAAALLRPE